MSRKVLFLIESLNVGGAEKALTTLLNRFDDPSCEITLKVICKKGAFIDDVSRIEHINTEYIITPYYNRLRQFFNAVKAKAIYKVLPNRWVGDYLCHGYDVVIAFCEGYLTKWVAASTVKAKKIAWVHTDMVGNDWPLASGLFHCLEEEQHAYSRFDEVVAVSEIVKDGMISRFGVKNVKTVYNIIDGEISSKSQAPILHPFSASLNLVTVGRLEDVKGCDQLVMAVGRLKAKGDFDVSLTFVGDGSQRNTLNSLIKELDVQDCVSLVGSQGNPYPYMANADLMVCPSRQEGFNIAILEAMSLGKPILATKSAGPTEILANGEYGMLVDNGVDGLAEGIEKFYKERSLLDFYSRKSIKRYNCFSADEQIEKIVSLFS